MRRRRRSRPTLLLRVGDRGDAVRDLQQRLTQCGHSVTLDGSFGDETLAAVREFQARRGVRVDGICGAETWGALIESSYALGDRLLYISAPMLRGDDVSELQRRLNALGFDAGREDGIFGPDTETALRQFQRERGLELPDGVCGPATIAALVTVGSLAAGRSPRFASATCLRRQRVDACATVACSSSSTPGSPRSARPPAGGCSTRARRSRSTPRATTTRCSPRRPTRSPPTCASRSSPEPSPARAARTSRTRPSGAKAGLYLAHGMTEQLRSVLPRVDDPAGRTYRLLRETRMAAVVCELFSRDEPAGAADAHVAGPELADALAVGSAARHRAADRRRALSAPYRLSSGVRPPSVITR